MTDKVKAVDSDGLPPGMSEADLPLFGQKVSVTFEGMFYAIGGKYAKFVRQCRVLYALKKVLVLQDTATNNMYVIDRKSRLSLGCQMRTRITLNGKEVV